MTTISIQLKPIRYGSHVYKYVITIVAKISANKKICEAHQRKHYLGIVSDAICPWRIALLPTVKRDLFLEAAILACLYDTHRGEEASTIVLGMVLLHNLLKIEVISMFVSCYPPLHELVFTHHRISFY